MATAVDPVSVAVRLGLKFTKNGPGEERIFRCPFCGDSRKHPDKGHFYLNAATGHWKCHRCGEEGGLVGLARRLRGVDGREARQMLGLDEPVPEPPRASRNPDGLAPVEHRNEVYRAFLSVLSLYPSHKDDLLRRGLDEESIRRNGYRSVPEDARHRWKICRWLVREHSLEGVPGFFTRSGRYGPYWDFFGPAGYLIPVRAPEGLIQALKVRCDDSGNGKYLWFSSHGKPNGASPGSPAHCAGSGTGVWVTEGPLKADVAAHLMDSRFVGSGGAAAWKAALDVLNAVGAKTPVIAFDADLRKSEAENQAREFVAELKKQGFSPRRATWLHAQGKGIDDVLLKLHRKEVSSVTLLLDGVPVTITRTVTMEVAVGRKEA
ncbi:MAG: DUF3854 domain-containing protein [Desulforudis sp.]|nr:MAG: DUF3854 domain-containing protein [Desulforudis sp.]